MISDLGFRISAFFRRWMPDPFVLAILLTALTALLALFFGFSTGPDDPRPSFPERAVRLLDAWRADDGLWRFLAFGMQMCLILVTGYALAASRPVQRTIAVLADLPRSTAGAAAIVALAASLTAIVNWGMGLIVGALLAREAGRSLDRRAIAAHYPLLAAAGYTGLLVWHGGLSGSAPLSMTTLEGASKVIPPTALNALEGAGLPLSQTIFSPLNLFVTLGLVAIIPILLSRLAPRAGQPVESFAGFHVAGEESVAGGEAPPSGLPDRLERSRWLAWLLAAALLAGLVRFGQTRGLGRLGLNEVNLAMLGLGLLLHGSLRSYGRAAARGVRGCTGIILQFPLYAGILAMMVASGLTSRFAGALSAGGSEALPLLTCLGAGAINLFVPSGGGQWGIQGPIALASAFEAGIAPGKMVMAVAYGDELTNMLQPFWALPLLAITGVRARDIVGYTAVVMLFAWLWVLTGLLLF
jgi:short-chain fatty acids transporter